MYQWQGAGTFLLTAIQKSDVYALEAWLLIAATFVIVLNLIADLLYGVLDPRIRYA
ncbi:MAG TPA: ABC transporter permease subunit [Amycolatopsis sp.]|nr:ABC transporter permease subunit [Amycolatopsis sp.]